MVNSQKTSVADGETLKPIAESVPVNITSDGLLVNVSLRDWFAGMVMRDRSWMVDLKDSAAMCYKIADAMMAEREKGGKK